MPFDAMFLTAVAAELRPALVGARVDKIQQPARVTVVLQLRGRDCCCPPTAAGRAST